MAKHLTDKDIEQISDILDGWQDKLSWEVLCDACLPVIGTKPARQTLIKFVRITNAFNACKKRLKEDAPELRAPPSMRVAIERIARLARGRSHQGQALSSHAAQADCNPVPRG